LVAIPSIQVGFSIWFAPLRAAIAKAEVAIPSIQVGFSIPRPPDDTGWNNKSQSLLFRSVFPFVVWRKNGKVDGQKVAIPSIQVGFSIPDHWQGAG